MSLPNQAKRKIFDERYEILSIVGRGADSVVYHARHIKGSAQEVAIKVLINRDGTTTLTDKLRKEALTLVSCRHKYVVRLDDFHSIKELCYLSMEYAPLGDLTKFIKAHNNRLPAKYASSFLRQALEALDFIHATGVIHRDIKPENILVVSESEIRLADFGLALLPGEEIQIQELRDAVGTFDYLAPEVLDGINYETRSDLYSLGVSFYEAIAGSHPFSSVPLARQREARQDINIKPLLELAPELPANTAAVIDQLIRFDASHRLQSASDALSALADPDFRGFKALNSDTSEPSSSAEANQSPAIVSSPAPAISEPALADNSESQMNFTEPTNDDQIPSDEKTPSTSSHPTETIDLERVKAIIARETARRNATDTSSLTAANDDAVNNSKSRRLKSRNSKQSAKDSSSPNLIVSAARSILSFVWNFFCKLPSSVQPIAVAIIFAFLTIGLLTIWNSLFGSSGSASSVQLARQTESGRAELDESAESRESVAIRLKDLPLGVHTGVVTGLIPGPGIPMAIISGPEEGRFTLLLGLDGWIPSSIDTSDSNSAGADSTNEDNLTFRANGLILKLNQELSSSEITGTITDIVTGESGEWKLTHNSPVSDSSNSDS